jgi:predicted MPP superfamily phosphohydrolase
MAHYPQFFDAAAARGVELVLSGHTHGGQIGIPGFAHRFNVMSFSPHYSVYARGLHRRDKSTLYVNAGLGTTGPPMRLGVRPEITVFELAADGT